MIHNRQKHNEIFILHLSTSSNEVDRQGELETINKSKMMKWNDECW